MKIGNYNMFEVGCTIDSTDIDDLNEFGVKCTVARGCNIKSNCKLNPLVNLGEGTRLPMHSIVISDGFIRTNTEPLMDTKKNHMKDMSTTLAGLLPKNSNTHKVDVNGILRPEEDKPATATVKPGAPSTSARPTNATA